MKEITHKNITDAELLEFATKHIGYEVVHFDYSVHRLYHHVFVDDYERNTMFTVFANHLRCLHRFVFTDQSGWKDEAFAIHYFKDPKTWLENRPSKSPLLETMHGWTDIWVAHLSYNRLQEQPWWIWLDAHDEMRIILRAFVLSVDPQLIPQGLREFEQHWSWTNELPRRPTPTPDADSPQS